jgi:hypothetical protein
VITITPAIERDPFYPAFQGTAGERLPDEDCRRGVSTIRTLGADIYLLAAGGNKGSAPLVINDLCVNVLIAAEHSETRALAGSSHAIADSPVSVLPLFLNSFFQTHDGSYRV